MNLLQILIWYPLCVMFNSLARRLESRIGNTYLLLCKLFFDQRWMPLVVEGEGREVLSRVWGGIQSL